MEGWRLVTLVVDGGVLADSLRTVTAGRADFKANVGLELSG
jgi:hypothetical protein